MAQTHEEVDRKETGIVHSITSPLSFLRWIKTPAVHPAIFSAYAKKGEVIDTPPAVDPDHILSGSFLKTFSLEGYVPSKTQVTMADGKESLVRDWHIAEGNAGLPLPAAIVWSPLVSALSKELLL